MADSSTSNATGPTTPPPGTSSPDFVPELKSTPSAVGTAVVSEYIGALGVDVGDVRPWITQDIHDHKKCDIDPTLQELLYRCGDTSEPVPDKSILLKACFDAVLPICNENDDIKQYLTSFATCTVETDSYGHFAQAANTALLRLSSVDVPGLPSPKEHDDSSNILFHRNDPMPICQTHQGMESKRKPDVVVVSCQTAARSNEKKGGSKKKSGSRKKAKGGKEPESSKEEDGIYTEVASKAPLKNFEWMDVLSTVEFKRSKNANKTIKPPPTSKYEIKEHVPPTQPYMDLRKELKEMKEMQEGAEQPSAMPASVAASSSKVSSQPSRHSDRLGTKRDSEHLASNERSTKRSKSNHNQNAGEKEEKKPIKLPAIVQNGLYVAEMFAAHIARQHVISCVINDDIIYVWYFDRQSGIQCAGFNFIQDLPRFLVFLLIMQRMQYAQWGMNPLFDSNPTFVTDKDNRKVDLRFNVESEDRTTHFGLRGRATNVLPVTSDVLSSLPRARHSLNDTKELVAKLYWPEESRQSEADILEEVYKIADGKREQMTEEERKQVDSHVPEMVWFHKFEDTSTGSIREALKIKDARRGSRVFYIIVFMKLRQITELSGQEFLRAWWHAVLCHRVLWKYGVRHRDISVSNLMYYKTSDGLIIGVLNDYDLSSVRDNPTGTERTGTVPFMALDLLTKEALQGKVEHLYRHDAESFIWVLTWVCLRYKDGELNSTILNDWLKVDAIGCHKEKSSFQSNGRFNAEPMTSHLLNWQIVRPCLTTIAHFYADDPRSVLADDVVFRTWLEAHVVPKL